MPEKGGRHRKGIEQMKISIKQIKAQKGRRLLMTSDLHGCWRRLDRLLRQVGFCDNDMLFILGDLIEKGRENLASLRYVMKLSQRDNVTVLMGNVDLSRLEMLECLREESSKKLYEYLLKMRGWRGTSIFDEMGAELGITLDSPEKIIASKSTLLEGFRREFDFIRSLPTIVEITNEALPSGSPQTPELPADSPNLVPKGYILVHGGLPGEDLEAVRDMDIRRVLKFDNFMASGLSFDKYVVAGHWPVNICNDRIMQFNPIIDRQRHIISIDGGSGLHDEGQLNMVILPEADCSIDRISHVFCDDFPIFEALTSQEPSALSVNLHFLNGKLRILKHGEEFSRAEHVDSGRVLDILNSCMRRRDGQWVSSHYTDYLLPVNVGDRLSLAAQTSQGYLVKKDGVCGWYKGRLRESHPRLGHPAAQANLDMEGQNYPNSSL